MYTYNKPELSDVESISDKLSTELFSKYLKLQSTKSNSYAYVKVENLTINFYTLQYSVPIDFENKLTSYIKDKSVQIIIIPIELIYMNSSHYNIMIINKKNKKYEYFEPMGQMYEHEIPYFIVLEHIFDILMYNKFLGIHFKFKDVHNLCPNRKGLQYKEHLIFQNKYGPLTKQGEQFGNFGHCVAWSLLCAHLRILNPDIEIDEIISELFKNNSPEQLHSYIQKYIHLIENTEFTTSNDRPEIHIRTLKLLKKEEDKNKKLLTHFKKTNNEKMLNFIHFPFYKLILTENEEWYNDIINRVKDIKVKE